MFLKFKPFTGPVSFEFEDPDTHYKYKAQNRSELVRLIMSYRAQNNLPPIEEVFMVVETYLCRMPVHRGLCAPVTTLKRGILGYLKGGIALATNLWYSKTVTKEEADRRAAICVQCPLNVFPDKGAFLQWSDDIAEASVGDKKSAYHNELGNCAGCSCPLRAKVFFAGNITLTEEEKTVMRKASPQCWQLEGLKNE